MLKEDFLESYFQYKLEEAHIISSSTPPEEEPYKNFYRAREIYQEVLDDEMLSNGNETDPDVIAMRGQLKFLLGQNYYETEEMGQGKKFFENSLNEFSKLSYKRVIPFLNNFLEIYNALGLIQLNSGEDEVGMAYLIKSQKLYEKITELLQEKKYSSYNTVDLYSSCLRDHNLSPLAKSSRPETFSVFKKYGDDIKPIFRFYYQGGLNIERAEDAYTLTCFYLAQGKLYLF